MARARLLKPGFFTNDELVELPFEARLLFAGLWTIADRRGRLEDRPKRIKIELFPADDVDVEVMLQALNSRGFIHRYVVAGQMLIHVRSFPKHQTPHGREPESRLPACDCEQSITEPAQGETGASTVPDQGQHETGPSVTGNRYTVTSSGSGSEPTTAALEDELSEKEKQVGNLIRSWENATATTVTRTLGDNLADWLERLPEAAIVKAIAETGASNARNWRYCEAILRRYETEGWADKPKGRVITFDDDLPLPEGMALPEVRFQR